MGTMTTARASRLNNSQTLFEELIGIIFLFILFSILAVLWGTVTIAALLISTYQKARSHAKAKA